jgi:hypothetical protein
MDMLLHLGLFSCIAYRKQIHFSAFVLTDLWSNWISHSTNMYSRFPIVWELHSYKRLS